MINTADLKQFRGHHPARAKINKKYFYYEGGLAQKGPVTTRSLPVDYSYSFIKRVIEYYWDIVSSVKSVDLPLRESDTAYSRLPGEGERLAAKLGHWASHMSVLQAGYYISTLYTRIIPPERRASLGVFYTPPLVVNRLIDNVTENHFDWRTGKILDPACGGGAFLAPLALKIIKESTGQEPLEIVEDIQQRLKGYEIDNFAAWMSMVFLDAALLDIYKKTGRRIKNIVDVRDTLTYATHAGESFDLIIGNPPYGKVTLQKDLRKLYSRSLYGHANLYGLFIDAAIRMAAPGALIAFVTSTSYLGGMYFKSLRDLIRREAPPVTMDFIEDRKGVFDEVLQETLITLFRKGLKKQTPVSINVIGTNGGDMSAEVEPVGEFIPCVEENESWKIPREKAHLALFEKIKGMKNRLEDLGYTAITGQLVWNRHKEQLTGRFPKNAYPLIWAESIQNNERFKFSFGKKNHKPYFKLRENQEYLLTKESCILVQRTTAKEQKRRIISAILPAAFIDKYNAVVVENHLNIIKPINKDVRISLKTLMYILNSKALDIVFRSINGSVAVSAYEIKSLPLPDDSLLQILENMIAANVSREKIENQINRIYGVNDVAT